MVIVGVIMLTIRSRHVDITINNIKFGEINKRFKLLDARNMADDDALAHKECSKHCGLSSSFQENLTKHVSFFYTGPMSLSSLNPLMKIPITSMVLLMEPTNKLNTLK